MIIRKKNIQKKSDESSKQKRSSKSKSVIKKQDLILDTKNVKDTKDPSPSIAKNAPEVKKNEMENFEKIDISEIEFKERAERRRGDRRRGYRRIDERSLVTRAQQEAHTIKELAAREGYQAGLKEAQEEVEKLKTSLSEFLNSKDEMYEEFYPHITEIALVATQKIIKKEVELSQDVLKNVIAGAMDELNSDTQKIEVKVNPDDVEFAKLSLPDIIDTTSQGVKILVTPDETIEQGSCIILANNGVIDASFRTQLAVLQNAFGIYKGGI